MQRVSPAWPFLGLSSSVQCILLCPFEKTIVSLSFVQYFLVFTPSRVDIAASENLLMCSLYFS